MRLAGPVMAGDAVAGLGGPDAGAPVPAGPVARAGGAAADYEAHAEVQARVAVALARRIAAGGFREGRLLELGCGTGLLTRALAAEGLRGDWLVTDLAPEMVARCAAACAGLAGPTLRFATLDAARPDHAGRFDLIVSSMAFQWLADLPAALMALAARVAPGGALTFAMPIAGTFAEWNAACVAAGAEAGGLVYPDADALAAMLPGLAVEVVEERVDYGSARAFLRAVKGVGAGTARAGYRPLSPAHLRAACAAFEAMGGRATYRIAFGRWVRAA